MAAFQPGYNQETTEQSILLKTFIKIFMKQLSIFIAVCLLTFAAKAQNNQQLKEKEKRIAPNGIFSTGTNVAAPAQASRPARSKETLQKLIAPNGVFATGQSSNAKAASVQSKENVQLASSVSAEAASAQRKQAEAKNDASARSNPLRLIQSQDEKQAAPASKSITPLKPVQVLKKKE